MTDTYLWKQEPMISAAPIETLHHMIHVQEEEVFEAAVFKLENDKFLYISYSSDFRSEDGVGVTDIEEFDNLEDAVKLYKESVE